MSRRFFKFLLVDECTKLLGLLTKRVNDFGITNAFFVERFKLIGKLVKELHFFGGHQSRFLMGVE